MTKPEQEIVPFIYDNKLQVCDILKKTKHLILSTKKYSNYIEKYTDITQTTTFKLPEITSYPILKNNDLIPLNKTTFNFFRPNSYGNPLFGETGTNFDNNKEIINKKSPRPKTENNVRNNPSKKIQFNSNNDECKNENISKLNISICEKNEENDLKQNEDNQNEEGDIKFNNLEEKVEIIPNFYEDSKIETTKLLQENILKINQIKRSANFSENNHHIKSNSIKLKEISEMNEYLANSIKSINQKTFTSLFQSSYKETDEVNNRTIKLKSFHIQFKNLNSHNSNSTNSLEIYLPLDYIPIFYSLDSQMIIYILVMSCQFKGDSEVEFRHENVALLIERSEIFKNQTIFSPIKHFNSIKFNWFVPKIIYEVTIRFPKIKISLKKTHNLIFKIIDYDTLMNLYDNKFENWLNVTKDYLNNNKKYRLTMNKFDSKLSSNRIGLGEEFDLDVDVPKFFMETDKSYLFGLTLNNINKFVSLNTYKINCEIPKALISYEFNFKQFRLIEKFSKYLSLDHFLKKFIIVNNDKEPFLSFDLTYFNFIDDKFLKYLKSSEGSNPKLTSNITSEIRKPLMDLKHINNREIVTEEFEIPQTTIDKLLNTDINNWKKIIFDMIKETIIFSEQSKLNPQANESQKINKFSMINK